MSCVKCFYVFYADDIVLLCTSVKGLQTMLNKCYEISCAIALQFNVNKYHCIVMGKTHKKYFSDASCKNLIHWCNNIKYLGVHLFSDKSVKFDFTQLKEVFYSACSAIFSVMKLMKLLFCITVAELTP